MNTLLTPADAAKRLSISLKTLREHVRDGSITYVLTGRGTKRQRYAFAQSDLDQFEQDRRRRRTPEAPPCQSIGRKRARSTTTISGEVVIGFTALRARQLSEPRKP